MKIMVIIFSLKLFSAEVGEDPSNVDCIKSVHGSRPFLSTIKRPESEEPDVIKIKEIKTISK